MWIERTTFRTAYPLPGILRWFVVTSTETVRRGLGGSRALPKWTQPSALPGAQAGARGVCPACAMLHGQQGQCVGSSRGAGGGSATAATVLCVGFVPLAEVGVWPTSREPQEPQQWRCDVPWLGCHRMLQAQGWMSAACVSAVVLRLCTPLWHSCTPKVTPVLTQVSCSLAAASCPWG